MKFKQLAIGLILTSAITLVGCANTGESIEDSRQPQQQEQQTDQEEQTEGDSMITNVMANITDLFNSEGLKVKEVTPFDGYQLDMGGNTTKDGGRLQDMNDTRPVALSEDLWYFNVKFENGYSTIVKYVIETDTYQGCAVISSAEQGFMDKSYGYMSLDDSETALAFDLEYVNRIKEDIKQADADKKASEEYVDKWEEENFDENGNYVPPTYEDKPMESQMPENVQIEEQEEGITIEDAQ